MEPTKPKFLCEWCGQSFTSKSVLIKHTKTTKYCLELQEKINEKEPIKCEFCSLQFTIKPNLERHIKICKFRENKYVNEIHLSEINELKRSHKKEIDKLNEKLKKENELSMKHVKTTEEVYKDKINNIVKSNEIERTKYLRDIETEKRELVCLEVILESRDAQIKELELKLNIESFKHQVISENSVKCVKKNNTLNCKLQHIITTTINPLTLDYIRTNIHLYTYDDFIKGNEGLFSYIKKIMTKQIEGTDDCEQNYVCTSPTRIEFSRLNKKDPINWVSDGEGIYVSKILDSLKDVTEQHYKKFESVQEEQDKIKTIGDYEMERILSRVICNINLDTRENYLLHCKKMNIPPIASSTGKQAELTKLTKIKDQFTPVYDGITEVGQPRKSLFNRIRTELSLYVVLNK